MIRRYFVFLMCVCERETKSPWHSREVRSSLGTWGEKSSAWKCRLARNVLVEGSDGDAVWL